ncbi:hypothetical protein B0H19DRAFT_1084508 [Mycena capillaripes]|nr:hypothetical protein B0H19DRAFT_1084508 [Mycena capillaripes]
MKLLAILLSAATAAFATQHERLLRPPLATWSGVPEAGVCQATPGAVSLSITVGTETNCEIDVFATSHPPASLPSGSSASLPGENLHRDRKSQCLPNGWNSNCTSGHCDPPNNSLRSVQLLYISLQLRARYSRPGAHISGKSANTFRTVELLHARAIIFGTMYT